jgi:hypothetical protein
MHNKSMPLRKAAADLLINCTFMDCEIRMKHVIVSVNHNDSH